jgi:hypothetical protein
VDEIDIDISVLSHLTLCILFTSGLYEPRKDLGQEGLKVCIIRV